jgi:hypothetical protein
MDLKLYMEINMITNCLFRMTKYCILISSICFGCLHASAEERFAKYYFHDKDNINTNYSVLMPTKSVSLITKRLNGSGGYEAVAPSYLSGCISELAQSLTGNRFHSYGVVRNKWYRFGAEDADLFMKETIKITNILKEFGFIKCQIVGRYSLDRSFTDKDENILAYVYCNKKKEDSFKSKIMLGEKPFVDLVITGWLSPPGPYVMGGSGTSFTRVFIVE